jgi:hypothetical protein
MNSKNLLAKVSILFILVLFLGTNVSSIQFDYSEETDYTESTFIGIDTATIAAAKLNSLRKSSFTCYSIEEIVIDDRCLFCIAHLVPQGYIVVSSHYALPPVLAYSFTSEFSNDSSEENILLNLLIADVNLRLENLHMMPSTSLTQNNQEWNALLAMDSASSTQLSFYQWPTEETTRTGGWLETTWHQDAPFNNFCPIDQASGDRSVAGCPAIAMAQILNYHQTIHETLCNDSDDYYHTYAGNNFWIDDDHEEYEFLSFPALNSYLEALTAHHHSQTTLTDDDKAAITFACGVAAEQVYHPEGSGTFGVNQAQQAYLRFSFESIELLDEDDPDLYDRVIANIIDALPVHLAIVNDAWNVGHNLVIDGYNTDGYYHLNFGWGGPYNGWYLLPDDLPF